MPKHRLLLLLTSLLPSAIRCEVLILFPIMKKFLSAVLAVFFLFAACWPADHYSTAAPVELNKDGRRWVEQTLKQLSLEEKVGQMLSVRYYTDFQKQRSEEHTSELQSR